LYYEAKQQTGVSIVRNKATKKIIRKNVNKDAFSLSPLFTLANGEESFYSTKTEEKQNETNLIKTNTYATYAK